MNTRPNTSQADRDVLEDVGLPDVLERTHEPVLLSGDERLAT
jgi:hypothetical protein